MEDWLRDSSACPTANHSGSHYTSRTSFNEKVLDFIKSGGLDKTELSLMLL